MKWAFFGPLTLIVYISRIEELLYFERLHACIVVLRT
jgi:hypothetical protein